MAKFKITDGSVTQKGGKTYLEVTFTDEVNGKQSVTQLHEIESIDEVVIAEQLTLSAIEFENRLGEKVQTVNQIETGVEVKAEIVSPVIPVDPNTVL